MKVLLKTNWYTPSNRLYNPGEHDFPDRFRKILPKSAKILDDEEEGDGFEEVEPDWTEEADGVAVEAGKNGWYTLTYAGEDDKPVEEKVQGEEAAQAKAKELRAELSTAE